MKIGFGKSDVTPRVGVELSGFGPFLLRRSVGVRDPLSARAMAIELDGKRFVLIACDLIGTDAHAVQRVREQLHRDVGLPAEAVMVHCSHTHSGPNPVGYIGWGAADELYMETLPQRIAKAGADAVANLVEAELSHAEVPCEGIGLNREYDQDGQTLEDVLRDDWRPARPELTDTTCHVFRAESGGRLLGFASYFGCHPVVCCAKTHQIHGDYCGVATAMLERENPGAVGLFLQGAQGDVNTCVVHKPEQESLQALDVIAARYANAVRHGLGETKPLAVADLAFEQQKVTFTRKPWDLAELRRRLAEQEALVHADDATNSDSARSGGRELGIATVSMIGLRRLVAAAERGESLSPPFELHGVRIGPVALLGTPFEIFQAIKNDVRAAAGTALTLIMGLTNDSRGYAPDRTAAARGGYAADFVPLILGTVPFANIHDELVAALLQLEAALHVPV